MKLRHALILLALCGCEAREVEMGEELTVEEVLAPSACEPVNFEDTPMTLCTADPQLHTIRTVLADDEGTPFRSLSAYAEARPEYAPLVAFAMNGGMFDEQGRPIGYFVEDRERRQRLNRNEGPGNFHLQPNGVFYGEHSGPWRVWDTQRFFDDVDQRPDFGTQSGPMLILAGEMHPEIDPDGTSLKIRNGVGVDSGGRAHFLISEEPVSFGRFARYFRDVLKTPNALFLDGTVSQLWDPPGGRMDGGPPLGPLIVVEMRENGE